MALLLVLALTLIGLSAYLVLRSFAAGRAQRQDTLSQIAAYGFGGAPAAGGAPSRTRGLTTSEIAIRVGTVVERRLAAGKQREIRLMLNAAGYYRTTVTRYLGYRALLAIGMPALFLMLLLAQGNASVGKVMGIAVAAGLGFYVPRLLVLRRIRSRTDRIDYEIPELVDLLVTTIEAGVGFGSALQLSARRVREPLAQELRLTLREQSMGLTIQEALENMLARCNQSTSARAFVQAIIQGETLGVSIGKILRDLAVDMRKQRRQRAEERAQKAPIKLLFPLVLLILPSLLLVVLGPPLYALVKGLGGSFGIGGG